MAEKAEIKKCFRHRIYPLDKRKCALCEAYKEAQGDVDKARRLFVKGFKE